MAQKAKAKCNAPFSVSDFSDLWIRLASANNNSQGLDYDASNESGSTLTQHLGYNPSNESGSTLTEHLGYNPSNESGSTLTERLLTEHLGYNPSYESGLTLTEHLDPDILNNLRGTVRAEVEKYTEQLRHFDPNFADEKADTQSMASQSQATPLPPNNSIGAVLWSEMWARLYANPITQAYLQNKDFVRMMHELHDTYLKDKRIVQALAVYFWTPTSVDKEMPQSSSFLSLLPEGKRGTEAELVEEMELKMGEGMERESPAEELDLMELKAEEGTDRESLAEELDTEWQAFTEQELGNAAYAKNDFCTAIGHYTKVMVLDSENILCLLNRAVAYLAMGQYEECIEDCDKAIERGKQLKSDSMMIDLALATKGSALVKVARLSKDHVPTLETFQKALSEHHNAEKAKRELGLQEYFDTKLADEEQEKDEKTEKQIVLEPHGMVFDVEAVKMTDSSEQKKFVIEEIDNDASQTRQPEGVQVEKMQPQALSTLKPQGMVFDVEAVEINKSSGQTKFQIENIGMEPEASDQHGLFLMQGGLGLTKPLKDEDWKNAKEIYLMDNVLSMLPENPRCPNLLALFLPRNYKLRMIPLSFFDYMPALQILNLSRTGIKSLPDSLSRLVSLKRLFLNDCHRLMTLPKVGDLKQLEVLDLEGAKIVDLPKEIEKLTNLTCLEISFDGYMSNCSRSMQSNAMIPCGVICSLSQLEELNIDVNPDDVRWDALVEDIVNEVCTLKRLETLKFYFPRVELLRHFQWNSPSLSHFRFTVGRHAKRFISRVPLDVEFELERWERCLKYINGMGVPRDVKNVLQHVTSFFLDRHATVNKLSDFGTRNMKQLKCCVVGECNEVQVIIDAADASGEDGISEIVLGSLEYLYIYYMKSLRSIWEGSVQQNSLFLLKSLTLHTCPQLTTIFTQGLLDNLCNLEELEVEDCLSIKSLVSCEISFEHRTSYFLLNLKKISLHHMPGLVSISSGLHIAPKLEWLSIFDCPNLKNLLIDEVSSQDFKKIKGERIWWEALEWSKGRPSFLDEIFVPIDIWDC